jgi:type IV pilus assembly protein PilE
MDLYKYDFSLVGEKMRNLKLEKGFTLIELMIVVTIIAILSAIALPSYNQYIIRSNRAAAQSAMMDIANRQQQFLLADREYADAAKLTASGYVLPTEVSDKYGLEINVDNLATPPTFEIILTPTGSQATDGNLTLNSEGAKTPAEKW